MFTLPPISPSSLNQPPTPSKMFMSGIPFTHAQSSIPTTLVAHRWTPSDLHGHPRPSLTNVVSIATTMGTDISGLLFISTNNLGNPLAITQPTQPMIIQVGNTLVLLSRRHTPSLGPNPLNLVKHSTTGSNPTLGQKPIPSTMGTTPIMNQLPTMGKNLSMGQNIPLVQNHTFG